MKRLLVPAALLLVAGCGPATVGTPPAPPGPASSSTMSPSSPARPSDQARLAAIVNDPHAHLSAARVGPGPEGYTVTTWWWVKRGSPEPAAIAVSDDGMKSPWYKTATWQHLDGPGAHRPPAPPRWVELQDLGYVPSLAPGVVGVDGGGDDGIFSKVGRKRDGHWVIQQITSVVGKHTYPVIDGSVILPDGRLLALVDWYTPLSPATHDLVASDAGDWTRFVPYAATFLPALGAAHLTGLWAVADAGRLGDEGLVWVTTDNNRLYVSTDAARTFHEIPARPTP